MGQMAIADTVLVEGHCSDAEATRAIPAPLEAEVGAESYVIGRQVKFFHDSECSNEMDGLVVDLSNPDNKLPAVSHCAFYKVFDQDKPRSSCMAVTVSDDGTMSHLNIPAEPCGTRRLILAVSENSSMNGEMGLEINAALSDIAQEMNGARECLAVDLSHSVDTSWQVLIEAEDMFWQTSSDGVDVSLGFANSNSEFLQDLEWINRTWGDQVSGLILIVDGGQVAPTDMTDSAPAMKWKIKETYRRVIDVSELGNCDMFRDVLLFEDCVHAGVGEIAGFLDQFMREGLAGMDAEVGETGN